ncbi:TonB-dependent receptor [Aridibaculum aurantiacum]|uniref:TonB-dependent receptor n=1 Tax=Aridibaculum aurantiacum TaxID=2810307 RepID=UPI001A96E35A|nr:TonB-dependent receptor [Aridibaculum aurantiacum]
MQLKKLFKLFIVLLLPFGLAAQVTTSNITGTVVNAAGDGLEGATVTATHQPSGTVYNTVTKKGGTFSLLNLRVGGPYQLTINYVGMRTETISDFSLSLGEPFIVKSTLTPESQVLTGVSVTTTRRTVVDRSAASTNVSNRQITALPTISRSLTDFTRLTPQANGNNIGGRDARYNNVTVDGANLNNNFGLSTDPLPGGGNQPISLDAIDQVTVSIAPYDVRQANFTGANIAAVTKSGTNTFRGSAYTYYRDQSFIGRNVAGFQLPEQATSTAKIFGGTLGGPIIKNKLFFFVNGEYENRISPPGTSWTPRGGSGRGNISNTPVDSLIKFSRHLRETYGYETGAYDNFPNFTSFNHKFLGKIDWNIVRGHKLTAKYNELVSENDVQLNATSVPNGATGGTNVWTSTARNGQNAMSFANSNYRFKDAVRSGALELNSTFGGRFSNQLLATFTKIRTTRVPNSTLFPFIDIIGDGTRTGAAATYAGGARNNYMSAGMEPYSNNNDVKNDIFNITDNFTYQLNRHSITVGGTYEQQYVGNMFMAASQSYYTYGSLQEFISGANPIAYALTYSRVPGKEAVYSAEMKIGQLGLYAQDEFTINSRLKVNYGVRIDRPTYLDQPLENPSITALAFPNKDGNGTRNYSTGMWPKSSWYWSPRASFRWDVSPEVERVTVRGGTGIFTGRIPFVYLTNMPTNSGMYQVQALANASQLSQITFDPNPTRWQSLFTAPAPTPNSAGFVLIDPEYKFPQVWRSNLGFDKKLGQTWTLSVDALYTKDLNATVMRNANQRTPTGVVNLGGGNTRPSFTNTSTATRRVHNSYANAIVLENAKGGGAFQFTTQINKSFARGFFGSLAYTFTDASDLTANPGSQASSTWQNNPTSGTQNDLQLAPSAFAVPHRIVGSLSYRKEYFKKLGTTVSLFYDGAAQGRFSYVYGAAAGTAPAGFSNTADINYDGNSQDLIYVPRNASEITFIPQTITITPASGGNPAVTRTYTAQEQSDAFFAFVEQDKYLRNRKGQVAERNGVVQPFYHRVDFKFLQDIFTDIGTRRHTLQFSVDCTNFLNLLNPNWGVRNFFVVNNPLRATKNPTTGEVRYQMATYTPSGSTTPQLVDRTYINNNNTASTWALMVGLRYIF